jgi:Holliday junction resolvase RusA-like endonuclease
MDRPDDICIISGFPMPPTTNHLYATVGKKRIKSKEYKQFRERVRIWMLQHHHELMLARNVSTKVGPRRFLHLDMTFRFHIDRILTKDSKPKKLDGSNRVKALEDVLCEMLGIDDCWVWSGSFDKSIQDPARDEDVEITLLVAEL